jgi:hypothetical protein
MVFVGFGTTCGWYKKGKATIKKTLKVKALGSSLIVLSAIYAIVAGFAITATLSNYAEALTLIKTPMKTPLYLLSFLYSEQNYFHNTVLMFGFFLVASTCYLGATFFLSYDVDPSKIPDLPKDTPSQQDEQRTDRVRFYTFIISFLQAVFLFLMSRKEAMSSIDLFVTWLFLLYFFNFVWSIIYLFISHALKLQHKLKNNTNLPLQVILPKAPLQWIPLNALTMLFLLVYVVYPHPVNSDWSTYISLLIVLFGSTLSDFYIAWNDVYSLVIRLS